MTRWTSRAWKRNAIRPSARVEHAGPPFDRPVAGERPLVEAERVRRRVGARLVERGATRRGEAPALLVAEVGLGRLQVGPVGLGLEALGGDGDDVVGDAFASGLAQQALDDHLALGVSALAEVVVPDPALRVGDVDGGPVVVGERLPDRVVAVERDRVLDAHVRRRPAHVLDVAFERELGRVDADHDQPLIRVSLGPGADVGERPEPVDARVRPEVGEHDLPLQVGGGERRRVEPAGRSVEARQVALDGKRRRRCGGC